jgi:serine/threonine protein kinase
VTFDRRIGRYRLERALGSGAFSTVWLAHDDDLQDLVAVKILAENWSRSEDARRRFVEEARALRRLDGDRIVRLYELAQLADGRPYMVMEFADHGSLEDRMRFARQTDSPFSVSEVAALGIELAGCLASVHAGKIVHRDVKPSNVLFRKVPVEMREALRRTGRPAPPERMLLGDFGIARRMETEGLTHVVGSPQYMAPEQADPVTAHLVDGRADVYAAGIVLYELLAGAPAGSRTDVRELRADVPPTMAAAIQRATARAPDGRYATAWELREDLVRSLGEPVHPSQIVRQDPRPAPAIHEAPTEVVRSMAPRASAFPPRAATDPPLPATTTDVLSGAEARVDPPTQAAPAARIGALDTCALDAIAAIAMVLAALVPWRAGTGGGHVTGLDLLAGRITFVAGGALTVAAVLRWSTRGAWGLRLARLISDVAGLAALVAVGMELATSDGAITAILRRGIHADVGIGVYAALGSAVVAFLAAGRAKRQLRNLRSGTAGGVVSGSTAGVRGERATHGITQSPR